MRLLRAGRAHLVGRGSRHRARAQRFSTVRPSPGPIRASDHDGPGGTPDSDGRVNLSLHLGATRDELLRAGNDPDRVLLVEINPHLPRTRSLPPRFDNTLPLDLIDVLVEADGEPYALEDPAPTDEDKAIASHALGFVTDESTLQTGIGAIPSMVATSLASGAGGGYGVHSEMFTTGLMRLQQSGKVTNHAKGIFDGVSVTTFALGTHDLYRWLDDNAEVAFLPVEVVNDPSVIGREPQAGVHKRRHLH